MHEPFQAVAFVACHGHLVPRIYRASGGSLVHSAAWEVLNVLCISDLKYYLLSLQYFFWPFTHIHTKPLLADSKHFQIFNHCLPVWCKAIRLYSLAFCWDRSRPEIRIQGELAGRFCFQFPLFQGEHILLLPQCPAGRWFVPSSPHSLSSTVAGLKLQENTISFVWQGVLLFDFWEPQLYLDNFITCISRLFRSFWLFLWEKRKKRPRFECFLSIQ